MNVLYYVRSFMKEIMLRDIWNESAEWLRYIVFAYLSCLRYSPTVLSLKS